MVLFRDGSRTAAKTKMEPFLIIVNGWKQLTTITKCSNLDVAAVLDLPLLLTLIFKSSFDSMKYNLIVGEGSWSKPSCFYALY